MQANLNPALPFRVHGLKLYAAVMWCNGVECGLKFDQPLDLEDMQGMLWITENRGALRADL